MRQLNLAAILASNPQIQVERVEEYLAYTKALQEEGADVTPQYKISSPLGQLSSTDKKEPASDGQLRVRASGR